MRVIFVNRFFLPDESATSRIVSSLALGLAAKGWAVHVITGQYGRYGERLSRSGDLASSVIVHGIYTPSFGGHGSISRLFAYFAFHFSTWRAIRRLVRSEDVVVVCTDPPLLCVTVALAAHRSKAAVVNWIFDMFPEAAIRLGLMQSQGLTARILCRLRDTALKRARQNVVVAPRMAKCLRERGIPVSRLTVGSLWAEEDEIRPIQACDNALRVKWRIEDKVVVGYSGNLGRVHEFATILDAAERLHRRRDIVFVFIGDGHRRAWLESEVERRGLGNVQMQPLQPRERLAAALSLPDMHLVSLMPELESCSFPSKLYGIFAAGRPTLFVGDIDGDAAHLLAEAGCGIAIAVGDDRGLAERIVELADTEPLRRRMGENARRAFELAFRRETAIDKWHGLLSAVSRPVAGVHPATLAGDMEMAESGPAFRIAALRPKATEEAPGR